MLIDDYTLEICNNHCLPGAESVNAIAHVEVSLDPVIPYINVELGGMQCTNNPPSVTFQSSGRLMSVQEHTITVNGVTDENHGRKIVEWLIREINATWQLRGEITPSFEVALKPTVIELLKYLPKTNCSKCGDPTCMVFAVRLKEGAKGAEQCPELESEQLKELEALLARFSFD